MSEHQNNMVYKKEQLIKEKNSKQFPFFNYNKSIKQKGGIIMKGKKLISMLLVGSMLCGGAVPAFAANEVETLSMLTYVDWYGDGMKALEEYINENSEQLGFKLEIQQIPGGSEGDELLAARTATNDLPDILNAYSLNKFYTLSGGEGKLIPLENMESEKDYDEDLLKTGLYSDEGQLYGLPFGTAYYYGFYYNKTVLEEAGVESLPENWEEFLEVCEKIKNIGKIPVYYSGVDGWTIQIFPMTGFNKEYEAFNMEETEFWDAINTNQIKFADCKNALDAIKKTKDLIDKGYVQDTYLSDTYDMAQTALANGDCAFYGCANTVVSEIASKYPEKINEIGGTIVPLFDTGENQLCIASPTVLSVTTASENPELAQKAVDFMCSAEAQEIYANAQSGVYINKNIDIDMPEALKEQSEYPQITAWDLKYAGNTMGTYLVDFFIGSKTAEEVLEGMDEEFAKSAEAAGDENWTNK